MIHLIPSTANFSPSDFFLVFACTINPVFTGRGGSLFFEWRMALIVCLLCFIVFNVISWPMLTAMVWSLNWHCSYQVWNFCQDSVKLDKAMVMEQSFCFSLEISPLNISFLSNICLCIIYAALDSKILSSLWEFWVASNNAFPTCLFNVNNINLPFLCSHSAGTHFRISSFNLVTFTLLIFLQTHLGFEAFPDTNGEILSL